MRSVNCAFAAVLAVFVSFFCACFSLGVEDMTEYNTRFPHVYTIPWDLSSHSTNMSDFVGTDEVDLSSNTSDLHTDTVDIYAYRAIAIEADSGDDNQYPSSTVSEFSLYLYYEGSDEVTLNYGIFVASSLPESNTADYVLSDTEDTTGTLYQDGDTAYAIDTDNMLVSGSTILSKGWTNIYKVFSSAITVNDGSYLTIVFYENNDYSVAVTSETTDNGQGQQVTTYKYAFTQYEDNDIKFSFDKPLLYVNSSSSSSSSSSSESSGN
ncbi:MAG: hypothetical protein LUI60_06050 [Clostridia bacterium]|nr:hypothetical protein [Clostridia bacterium]